MYNKRRTVDNTMKNGQINNCDKEKEEKDGSTKPFLRL